MNFDQKSFNKKVGSLKRRKFTEEVETKNTYFAIREKDVLVVKRNYFKGSWRNPKYWYSDILLIEIKKHSYGSLKGQHTFTCKVLKNYTTKDSYQDEFLIKGRNLYPNVIEHVQHIKSLEQSFEMY